LFREADLDPKVHVLSSGKADNFWMMGDTGPCGPCSEVHMDLTPDGDTRGALVNKGDPRCIEIWNLVFIQFNAQPVAGGGDPGRMEFTPLPQRHVDTGMGFERAVAIIQGTRNLTDFSGTISNYETDVFRPIFDELEKLSGKRYASTLPIVGQAHRLPHTNEGSRSGRPTTDDEQEKIDIAFRVIADHIRALSFAIADGIVPSNDGRGYVLRRILRRAVRYGRTLGFHEPFFFKLVDVVAKTMGHIFPEVRAKQKHIKETIKREEDSFNKTLDKGIRRFEIELSILNIFREIPEAIKAKEPLWRTWLAKGVGSADVAAEIDSLRSKLTATGIRFSALWEDEEREIWILPELDEILRALQKKDFTAALGHLTRVQVWSDRVQDVVTNRLPASTAFELSDTYGFPLDLTELMARERGLTVDVAGFEKLMEEQRERARAAQKKSIVEILQEQYDAPTDFVGYDVLEADAQLLGTLNDSRGRQFAILDKSPFYAEMGGQIGDRGEIQLSGCRKLKVINTTKRGGTYYHEIEGQWPTTWTTDLTEPAHATVDANRRKLIQGHHTATHLLHWALHQVVSNDATQKGSYVGPDKLTFDFSSAPLTKQQICNVEKLVNEKIAENAPVSWTEIPFAEAKQRKDIIQFFGEKYGDTVRVLQIGGSARELNGYSMELCGGTHVTSTGEIGPFRIMKEEAIAAGTRRIEAVAGDAARAWAKQEAARQEEKFETLARKKSDISALPAFQDDAATAEVLKQIDARAAHLERVDADVHEWEKKTAKSAEAELKSRAAQIANELAQSHADKNFCIAEVPDADGKLLQGVAEALKTKINGAIFLAGTRGGSVALVAYVPPALISKFQANKLIQQIAPIVGGKGGGRPESAQGAGKDPSKINDALSKARELLS
jgi:alanyl-tRNA synthetase